jgi:hypothetical protein
MELSFAWLLDAFSAPGVFRSNEKRLTPAYT